MNFLANSLGVALLVFALAKFYGRGFESKYQTGVTITFKSERLGMRVER